MSQGMGMSGKIRLSSLALSLGIVISSFFVISEAQAQWYGYRQHHFTPHHFPPIVEEMTPRELTHAVRSQGFNRLSRPVYYDEVAVVNAVAPNGQPVRITLDIYSGQIVNLSVLARRQVARVQPVPREEEPRKRRSQTVERSPDMRPTIRRPADVENKGVATLEKPTIVRRTPMLPPQPDKPPSTGKSVAGQVPANPGNVGSGTRATPRRIEIAPPANSEVASPPI